MRGFARRLPGSARRRRLAATDLRSRDFDAAAEAGRGVPDSAAGRGRLGSSKGVQRTVISTWSTNESNWNASRGAKTVWRMESSRRPASSTYGPASISETTCIRS